MKAKLLFEEFKKFDQSTMILNQLNSLRLILEKRDISTQTVDKKMKDVGMFFLHIKEQREKGIKIDWNNINEVLFRYVADGYFSVDNVDNTGTIGYRRSIYYNIQEGFNYIYEGLNNSQPVIKQLTKEKIEILDEISKNKWYRCKSYDYEDHSVNLSIQTQLIEQLGIKVYFDDNNKPYVYSHELAELIGKNNKDVLRDIRKITAKIHERNFAPMSQSTDFTMFEDVYEDERGQGAKVKTTTYRIYKDLLLIYILGLTGKEIIEFKMRYIDAFNYIEQEYNKSLQKYIELKESFLKMYNYMRKQNRDILIEQHKNNKNKLKVS